MSEPAPPPPMAGAPPTPEPAGDMPRHLHPATLLARWLRLVPQLIGGAAAYLAIVEGWGRILAVAAAAAAIGLAIALLVWWRFRYIVRPGELVIESGVLQRQRRVIPFSRVQDIAIEQGLLARLFGTAKVKVETGGSGADEGELDMIALSDARALRDHVRRDRGEAAPAAAAEPLLFTMGPGRLLYSGLFDFSLVFLALILAALQNLEQLNLVDIESWFNPERSGAFAGYLTLRTMLFLAPLLLVLGVVTGVARTFARDFGYRLTRTGEAGSRGFRRRRGLFTLTEVVIPVRRTQVALIESGPITRPLGWFKLSFQTLGAEMKEGGVQVAAPFARIEELAPIMAEAGFPMPPPRAEFARLPRRALIRRITPWLLLAALLAAPAAYLRVPEAGLAAAAMVVAAIFGALRWRRHGYALGERALFVTGGLFRRRLWVIPYARAQTISVSRGPFQRRLRLATLLVDTAGASPIRQPEIVDLDAAEADRLAGILLALFYRHRAASRQGRPEDRGAALERDPEPS